jgi:hypothetical protein
METKGTAGEAREINETLEFRCHLCGTELFVRRFDFEDENGNEEPPMYGIFDHCSGLDEQMIYPTVREAIEAFSG